MRSSIESLRAEPDFRSIIRRWPHAVQTREGVVIPRFADIADGVTLEACVSERAVTLRPLVRALAEGRWDDRKRRILRHIEAELGVTLQASAVSSPLGEVTLEEEWGDFSVSVR